MATAQFSREWLILALLATAASGLSSFAGQLVALPALPVGPSLGLDHALLANIAQHVLLEGNEVCGATT